MKLTEKETEILVNTLAMGQKHRIESSKMSRMARDLMLKVPLTKEVKEQIEALDGNIEEAIFGLNTVDRIIDSMEKGEPIVYHNQIK